MKTFEKQIEEAKIINWANVIAGKVEVLTEKYRNHINLFGMILNGDIIAEAQEEFCREKAQGLYDSQNIRIRDIICEN